MQLTTFFLTLLMLTNLSPLRSIQTAEKLIQEHLVDNNKENIGIASQLTEKEANELVLFLKDKGFAAEKRKTLSDQVNRMSEQIWEVTVAPTDTVEAIITLEESGYPKKKKVSIFEEFVHRIREGYTMDEAHQRLARQLEDYVEDQPGIVNAEVLIKWDKDPFNKEEILKTLLYVRHTGTLDDPNSEVSLKIKQHILDNVDNLEEEHFIFVPERETTMKYQFPEY